MTGSDIKNKVERYLDMNLKEQLILDAIEEAINWLGNKNYLITSTTETAEADAITSLPDDFIRVIKVEVPADNKYYYNWIIDGTDIRFKDADTYKIYYEKHPTLISSIGDELSMHQMLQACILTYTKGFVMTVRGNNPEMGFNLIKKFERDSVIAYETLKRGQKQPSRVRVIRHA